MRTVSFQAPIWLSSLFQRLTKPFESKTVIYMTAFIALIGAYFRIFFGAEVTDETYHVACAYLTALGNKFFENDSYIGQTASILYEPIIYVYNWVIGSFGVVLFVRHLYFALSVLCFLSFYRLLRNLIAPELALLITVIPVVFIPYTIPILSYNTLGSLFFGIGCALTLNSSISNKLYLSLLGGWAFSMSVFAYPPMVIGVAVFYGTLVIYKWTKKRVFDTNVAIGAVLSGALFLAFVGLTLYRFNLDKILHSIETTRAYGSGTLSTMESKWRYFESMIEILTPPVWTLSLVALCLIILKVLKFSWTWSIPLVCGLFLFTVQMPAYTLISPFVISFIFLIGLFAFLTPPAGKDLNEVSFIMAVTASILGLVLFINSGNQILATPLATQFGLIFVLAIAADKKFSRTAISLPMMALLFTLTYYSFSYTYREEPLSNMNTMIKSGPFAGIITSEFKARFLKQIEDDVNQASKGASSILFYDNFPAGFLFTNLRPASRSMFIHPVPYGSWDRELYTSYYANSANRPDIFVQFEAYPFTPTDVMQYRTQWTRAPYDTFFDYLPNTGEYEVSHQREFYRVWRKKTLPPMNN